MTSVEIYTGKPVVACPVYCPGCGIQIGYQPQGLGLQQDEKLAMCPRCSEQEAPANGRQLLTL